MTSATPISDSYTGDLSGSKTPQRRTLGSATIVKLSVGPMDNNVYVVTSKATGDQLIIDAANDADTIIATLDAIGGKPALIFTTHQHHDHVQALAAVAQHTGVPTAAGRFDAPELPVTPGSSRRRRGGRDRDRRPPLRGDPPRRPHPGSIALALTDTGVGRRHGPSVHRRLPVPRRHRQDLEARGLRHPHRGRLHQAVRPFRRLDRRLPGGTARTRLSAPNAPRCRSGASAAGRPVPVPPANPPFFSIFPPPGREVASSKKGGWVWRQVGTAGFEPPPPSGYLVLEALCQTCPPRDPEIPERITKSRFTCMDPEGG